MSDELVDARKAAAWSVLAGLAHLGVVAVGHLEYPYLYDVLIAIGYGLTLPCIAVLHPRHRRVRQSGAVLATIAGTAAVIVGLAASVDFELRPAALVILGMWWWTIGKLWVETGILPRWLGVPTSVLGVLTIAAALVGSMEAFLPNVASSAPVIWRAAQGALGVWLLAFSAAILRGAPTDRA